METVKGPTSSYYSVLGVNSESSIEEIRRAYRKLAMRWHPDRWTRSPSLLGEAKRRFQQIQESYSVLSDKRKRTMYDAGLYDPDDEDDEGLCDFVQELVSLMGESNREQRNYSMDDLREMFVEMVQGFESPSTPFFYGPSAANFEHSSRPGCAKRTRLSALDSNFSQKMNRGSAVDMYG